VIQRRAFANLYNGGYTVREELLLAKGKGLAALLLTLLLAVVTCAGATEKTIYSFAGGTGDGAYPNTNLVMDKTGNLYGTTDSGGIGDSCSPFGASCGVVYELQRSGATFTESVIYSFTGGTDGGLPYGNLIIDAKGNLYGTTYLGGNQFGCPGGPCGVVFELSKVNGTWQETILHDFGASGDGWYPNAGVVMDSKGNLYGTTNVGGISGACNADGFAGYGCGVVYELSPAGNATWSETILYEFTGGADGGFPNAPVTLDKSGNLYGVTSTWGDGSGCTDGCGTIFKLSPSQGNWTESTIYTFTGYADGGNPVTGLILDSAGNLYGTAQGGSAYYGSVFQLKPANSQWALNTLYTFSGGADGGSPVGSLVGKGTTLYGTTTGGGTGQGCGLFGGEPCGVIYSLAPGKSAWKETVLYSFTGGDDGGEPQTSVIFAPNGKIYGGAALIGGTHGLGTVYEITP
jgi:hypothetical protein